MWAAIIGAIAGGITGFIDNIMGDYYAGNDIETAKAREGQKYADDLALLELDFQNAKDEANKNAKRAEQNADLTDKQQDVAEQGLSDDYNAALDNLQDQQLKDAYDWNYYAINAGQSEGQAEAQLASSGVRSGSSMQTAIDMEAAVNSQQLQLTQDISRSQYDQAINSMGLGLANGMMNIQSNRMEADWTRQDAADLRASYEQGGANWNIYNQKKINMKHTYDYNVGQLNDQKQRMQDTAPWRNFSALLTGGATGAKAGYNLQTTFENYYTKPDYSTNLRDKKNKD